ncbi:MAG: ribonuclease HII [Propionibacteriaceae bacterium]|jgi:ribonuclease HII|nr:ribonuclease HII [Propionibacteriaceae bacterium]
MRLVADLEAQGFKLVAGADEAGRGACAGPLVAAAVILGDADIPGLDDSKRLSAKKRDELFSMIKWRAKAWAVVSVSPGECDEMGMQAANLEALRRALLALDPVPDFALTDGFGVDGLPMPNLGVWKGDRVAAPVSAASILAKVSRDRLMASLEGEYSGFHFAEHKGYCTAEHQREMVANGVTDIHRLSYGNVKAALAEHQSVGLVNHER